MTALISVTCPSNNFVWERNLPGKELKTIGGYCTGRATIYPFFAILKPVRTENLNDFLKDFFLPTLVNHALKVENIAYRTFAMLAAFVIDFATFPIRLLTCIPRIITNAKKSEHPLYRYLQKNHVDSRIFESDYVLVKYGAKISGIGQNASRWETKSVNFIELPFDESLDFHVKVSSSSNYSV